MSFVGSTKLGLPFAAVLGITPGSAHLHFVPRPAFTGAVTSLPFVFLGAVRGRFFLPSNFELPTCARAKIGSSPFTPPVRFSPAWTDCHRDYSTKNRTSDLRSSFASASFRSSSLAGHGDPSGQAAPTETCAAKSPVTSSDRPTFAAAIFPSANWSFHNHRTGCAATSAAIRATSRSIGRTGRAVRPDGLAPAPSFPRPPSEVSGINASIAIDAFPS